MTNNQLLMSVLRNSGQNYRAKNLNLTLGVFAIIGVISAIVVISKNTRLNKESKLLRKAYHGNLEKLHTMGEDHAALLFRFKEISKKFDVVLKENSTLKNGKTGESNS